MGISSVVEEFRQINGRRTSNGNFDVLLQNVSVNFLRNVTAFNIAAHDSCEELVLEGNNSDLLG